MSRFTRTVLSLLIVDIGLILFLTFGAAFPSRIAVPDPTVAQPDDFYDYSAKASPVGKPVKTTLAMASLSKLN